MAPDRLTDRPQQQVTSSAQEAPADHPLGVDEVAQARARHPDLETRVGDGAAAADVAFDRELDDPAEGQRLLAALAHELEDRRARRHRLETPPVPAVAEQAALVEGRVPDLAGRPRRATQELAVDHEPGADAGR